MKQKRFTEEQIIAVLAATAKLVAQHAPDDVTQTDEALIAAG